jgi:hypothetical protein
VGISKQHENLMNLEASFTPLHNTKLVPIPKEAVTNKNNHLSTSCSRKDKQIIT